MKAERAINPLAFFTVTASLVVNLSTQNNVNAEQNPFEFQEIESAEKSRQTDKDMEGNCGEGKCGEGNCGEGKCGEGKCGEGACGNMTLDMEGMVMNENKNNLPRDCPEISEDMEIEVSANRKFADLYPGTAFGFNQRQWNVKPCSRITVSFTNEDDVRHQWMVHGLPNYLYPQSMFHLEANGGYSKTGTFIVPSDDKTYLVHCDMAAHMEKGMKAQLVVGDGSGNLPGIPGITAARNPNKYPVENNILTWLLGIALSALSFFIPLKYFSRKN